MTNLLLVCSSFRLCLHRKFPRAAPLSKLSLRRCTQEVTRASPQSLLISCIKTSFFFNESLCTLCIMWGANQESALTLFTCGGCGVGRRGQLNWIGMIESPPRIPGRPTIPFFKAALVAPLKACLPFSFMAVCGFRGARKSQSFKC